MLLYCPPHCSRFIYQKLLHTQGHIIAMAGTASKSVTDTFSCLSFTGGVSLSCSHLCVNSSGSAFWRDSIGNSVSGLSKCCYKPLCSFGGIMPHVLLGSSAPCSPQQCRLSKRAYITSVAPFWIIYKSKMGHLWQGFFLVCNSLDPIKLNTFNLTCGQLCSFFSN